MCHVQGKGVEGAEGTVGALEERAQDWEVGAVMWPVRGKGVVGWAVGGWVQRRAATVGALQERAQDWEVGGTVAAQMPAWDHYNHSRSCPLAPAEWNHTGRSCFLQTVPRVQATRPILAEACLREGHAEEQPEQVCISGPGSSTAGQPIKKNAHQGCCCHVDTCKQHGPGWSGYGLGTAPDFLSTAQAQRLSKL